MPLPGNRLKGRAAALELCFLFHVRMIMKLRIRGNSVRLRVSQTELAEIAEAGRAEDAVRLGPQARLVYRIEVAPQGPVHARFDGGTLTVIVPRAEVERWLDPAEVALTGSQRVGDGEHLSILVEKDFACLAPRDEDQSDLFPNPGATQC